MIYKICIILITAYVCYGRIVEEKCRSERSCIHPETQERFLAGDSYFVGCRQCTCYKRKTKIITCYREAGSIFHILKSVIFYPMHYYVDVPLNVAQTLTCPFGFGQVKPKMTKTVYAEFFVTYVLIQDKAHCCTTKESAPILRDSACTAVYSMKDCAYNIVHKSNKRKPCKLQTTMVEERAKMEIDEEHSGDGMK